ncbi:MAG: protein-S-isoprenylcysteine O-methyltransferase [Bacteroidota bacterium]
MDTRLIFEIVFVVFIIMMGVIRRPFEKSVKDNNIDVQKKDTEEKWLLGLTFLGMSIIPLLYILSPWLDFADYQLPLLLQIFGVVLLIPAAVLFYRSHKDLGNNWSVSLEIREEHTLITEGIYKSIRHPMYTAIWLWVFCQALLLQNYIAGLSGIVCFGLLYFLRIGKEEKMMEAQFGEQYLQYKKQTKRLIPGLI